MSIHYHVIWTDLFGWPGTWGTGGNMVAWVICGTLAFSWLHGKEKARHLAKMAQAARHHQDQMALMASQHAAQMQLLRTQHSQLTGQVAANQTTAKPEPAPAPGGKRM